MKAVIVILLNQLGFYIHSPKIAIVAGQPSSAVFYIVRVPSGDTVYSGTLGAAVVSSNSSLRTYEADFTNFEKEGDYTIVVPGAETSYPFYIGRHMASPVVAAALKGYYYQRSAMALDERYAGR